MVYDLILPDRNPFDPIGQLLSIGSYGPERHELTDATWHLTRALTLGYAYVRKRHPSSGLKMEMEKSVGFRDSGIRGYASLGAIGLGLECFQCHMPHRECE